MSTHPGDPRLSRVPPTPTVVHSPELDHRQFCVGVWQGDILTAAGPLPWVSNCTTSCWQWPHCLWIAVGNSCRVSFDRATLWTCGSLKGTQRDCVGCVCVCVCVCVLFARGLAVWVPTNVGHAHAVAMSSSGAQPYVSGTAPSCGQWLCEVVIGVRGRRGHNGHPSRSGRVWGSEVTVRSYALGYVCCCGGGPMHSAATARACARTRAHA